MANKNPYKCLCCGRRGNHDQVLKGEFKHTAKCWVGKVERGERCPDCHSDKITTCTGREHDFGCPACGQRWDTETFLDEYQNDEQQTF